jgi:PAS domain S-box-containing protein
MRRKNVVLLLIALLSGACTALIDLYIILPHCSDLSEQKIVITYINAILVNLFVVIISIVHSINNKDEFLNVLIYSTLLPIFSKYYGFYSNSENSVYVVASEIIIIVLLVTALIYLKISYNIIKGKRLNIVEEANGNNSIINKFSIDKKRECKVNALSDNIGNFIDTYRNIEEDLQDILLLVDVYGRINYASKRFYSLSGLEEERVVGASFFTIAHPEEILKARVLINLEKNNTTPIVHRIRKNNGNYILAESIADFIFEEDNVMGKIIVSKDISNENL